MSEVQQLKAKSLYEVCDNRDA